MRCGLKIEVPREKARELYMFTDYYLTPKRFMTFSEYQRLVHRWSYVIIDLLFNDVCERIISDISGEEIEECPFNVEKMRDEIFDILEENEIEWVNIEPMDSDVHVDNKIHIAPVLDFKGNDYKIYLIIEALPGDVQRL